MLNVAFKLIGKNVAQPESLLQLRLQLRLELLDELRRLVQLLPLDGVGLGLARWYGIGRFLAL
jgi:hypothetical protein